MSEPAAVSGSGVRPGNRPRSERDAWYEQRNAESGGNFQPNSSSRPVVSSPGADRPDDDDPFLPSGYDRFGRWARVIQRSMRDTSDITRAGWHYYDTHAVVRLHEECMALADAEIAEALAASVRSGEQQ